MNRNDRGTVISTWFVQDDADTATFFPQVGTRSSDSETQMVYWRCICVFFATSRAVNDCRHLFFSNVAPPRIGDFDTAAFLKALGVECVTLPITHRLGGVASWGNQFYILDIIRHLATNPCGDRYVVLDSDCVWTRPVDDLVKVIDAHGAALYRIGYPDAHVINGATQGQMSDFLRAHGDVDLPLVPYCGGEIFAAAAREMPAIAATADRFWQVLTDSPDPELKEEAHLLSCVYAQLGYPAGTADPYIRRMWTSLRHNNLNKTDPERMIWHLPSEKRSGFAAAFRRLEASTAPGLPAGDFARADRRLLGRLMGVPRRGPAKLLHDVLARLRRAA